MLFGTIAVGWAKASYTSWQHEEVGRAAVHQKPVSFVERSH